MTVEMNSYYMSIFDPDYDIGRYNDPKALESTIDDLIAPVDSYQSDFSISAKRDWADVAKDILTLVLKMVFFPLTIIRYGLQRLVMTILYPAQSALLGNKPFELDAARINFALENKSKYIIRHVRLKKNGTIYSGLMIADPKTIRNGKWALQATGNAATVEGCAGVAHIYAQQGINTLLINGPGVGKSQGTATPSTMGDAQQVGIEFLETAIKANKIALSGTSLGAAAMGQAILKHNFKKDVEYVVLNQMTFDKSSHICAKLGPFPEFITRGIVKAVGLEMDNVKASKKLEKLKIREIVVQATNKKVEGQPKLEDFTSDHLIPAEASLGYNLIKQNIVANKVFCCLPHCDHNSQDALTESIKMIGWGEKTPVVQSPSLSQKLWNVLRFFV